MLPTISFYSSSISLWKSPPIWNLFFALSIDSTISLISKSSEGSLEQGLSSGSLRALELEVGSLIMFWEVARALRVSGLSQTLNISLTKV